MNVTEAIGARGAAVTETLESVGAEMTERLGASA